MGSEMCIRDRKNIALCATICLFFTSATLSYANTKTEIVSSESVLVDEITRERVYNEVLSGTITDEKAVLKVALEQYLQRKDNTKNLKLQIL